MFKEYLKNIKKLNNVHIEALEKYALYGQPMQIGRLIDKWSISDLLWSELVSLNDLKIKILEGEKKIKMFETESSKFDLEDETETNSEKSKNIHSIFTASELDVKVIFTWDDYVNALFAIIMIRTYHYAQKKAKYEKAKAEREALAKIKLLEIEVEKVDPKEALEKAKAEYEKIKN